MQTSQQRRQVGLEYLSVFGLPVLEYADLAARLECDFISLNFGGAANWMAPYPREDLRADKALRHSLKRSVSALGLRISLIEGFAIKADKPAAFYESDLDNAAELGARAICAVSLDKNLHRTYEQFSALAEAASTRDLLVTTEVGAGAMRTLDIAHDALIAVGHPNFQLLIDTMHYFRMGSSLDDLQNLPHGAIGHVQLCDVPTPAQIENYLEEALFERRGLEDGDLPLRAFVHALPPDVPLGLEIPIRSLAHRGVEAFDRLHPSLVKAREM